MGTKKSAVFLKHWKTGRTQTTLSSNTLEKLAGNVFIGSLERLDKHNVRVGLRPPRIKPLDADGHVGVCGGVDANKRVM